MLLTQSCGKEYPKTTAVLRWPEMVCSVNLGVERPHMGISWKYTLEYTTDKENGG